MINRPAALVKTMKAMNTLRFHPAQGWVHQAKRFIDSTQLRAGFTKRSPACRTGSDSSSPGFTMVEVVIILGIIVMISAILLANFPAFSRSINMQRSSQQLGLAFRRAQSMALAVREVDLGSGINGLLPGKHIPRAYGVSVNFSTSQTSYRIFADFNAGGGTVGVYDPLNDYIVENASLIGSGTFISSMVTDPNGSAQNQSILNVTFTVPGADMSIQSTGSPVLTVQSAVVELRNRAEPAGLKKSVTVVTTGQISIK